MKLTYDEREVDSKIRIGVSDRPLAGSFCDFKSPAIVATDIDGLKAIAFSEYWRGSGIEPKQVYLLVPIDTVRRKVINKKIPKNLITKKDVNDWLEHPDNIVEVKVMNRGKRK